MNTVRHTVPDLARELIADVTLLVRQELRLAQVETSNKVDAMQAGLIGVIAGLLLAFCALLILLESLVVGLSKVVEPWLASLIVGGSVAVIALILVAVGQSKLRLSRMVPERTLESLRSDRNTIREHINEPTR